MASDKSKGAKEMKNSKRGNKQAGLLSIFAGIWSGYWGYVLGFMTFHANALRSPRGGQAYEQFRQMMQYINVPFLGFFFVMCVLLIIGGAKLFKDKQDVRLTRAGLKGLYFYVLCLGAIAIVHSLAIRDVYMRTPWLINCILTVSPAVFTHWMLKPRGSSVTVGYDRRNK